MSKEYVAVGYNVENGVIYPIKSSDHMFFDFIIEENPVIHYKFKAGHILIKHEGGSYESFMCRKSISERLDSSLSCLRVVLVEKYLANKFYNDIVRSADCLNRWGLYHVYIGKHPIINDLSNFKPNRYFDTIKSLIDNYNTRYLKPGMINIEIKSTSFGHQLEKISLGHGDTLFEISKRYQFKILDIVSGDQVKDIVLEATRLQAYFLNEILYNNTNNTLKDFPL